jgi:gpW
MKRCKIPGIDPCAQLAAAQAQLLLLAGGQATVAIDTPQLGRVEFNKGSIGDLQRMVDMLRAQCAESQGITMARRRPISVEAIP